MEGTGTEPKQIPGHACIQGLAYQELRGDGSSHAVDFGRPFQDGNIHSGVYYTFTSMNFSDS